MCYRFGEPDLEKLQTVISSTRFTELIALEEMDPRGETRDDLRAGIVAATIANANRGKDSSPFAPKDFMVEFDQYVKPKSGGEIMRKLQLFTAMSGGKINGR